MKTILKRTSGVPAYLQLYTQVRDDIISGVYPLNTKLPSKRVIAEDMGVSTITVEHAYGLLCDEGYIESRERSGYFVIFRTDDGFVHAASKEKQSEAVYKCMYTDTHTYTHTYTHTHTHTHMYTHTYMHTNTEFPFSVLTKTMRKVISDSGPDILKSSPNVGLLELREAIRRYLARSRGINVDTEQIVIGSGSEYLYSLIVELLGRDKIYGIESPSYKKIEQVYVAADVVLEKLPLGKEGIDSAFLRTSSADILHISPYRSYPSGVTASASKRHEYMRWAKQGGRYIIEDDFESEFSVSKKTEETMFALASNDNVIYMNTFSKTISPSFRVGYMVLPKGLVTLFQERLGFYSCTVPTYTQLVLTELISNGDFERHINRVRRAKRKELQADKKK